MSKKNVPFAPKPDKWTMDNLAKDWPSVAQYIAYLEDLCRVMSDRAAAIPQHDQVVSEVFVSREICENCGESSSSCRNARIACCPECAHGWHKGITRDDLLSMVVRHESALSGPDKFDVFEPMWNRIDSMQKSFQLSSPQSQITREEIESCIRMTIENRCEPVNEHVSDETGGDPIPVQLVIVADVVRELTDEIYALQLSAPQAPTSDDDHVWAVVASDDESGEDIYLDELKRVWTKRPEFASLFKQSTAAGKAKEYGGRAVKMSPAVVRATQSPVVPDWVDGAE